MRHAAVVGNAQSVIITSAAHGGARADAPQAARLAASRAGRWTIRAADPHGIGDTAGMCRCARSAACPGASRAADTVRTARSAAAGTLRRACDDILDRGWVHAWPDSGLHLQRMAVSVLDALQKAITDDAPEPPAAMQAPGSSSAAGVASLLRAIRGYVRPSQSVAVYGAA